MKVTDSSFNPGGSQEIHIIKRAALAFQQAIEENTLPGRRQALALTHLETAAMYAVKAAAVGDNDG